MAVNKNFVVKNGLEVATDVILANATSKNVGIGSTQPTFTLDVRGGIGATDVKVSGFTTLSQDLQVGTSGSVFYVSDSNNNVGVGTSVPNSAYTLDVRSPVSTGQTALYVYGDMRVTGDINLDDITLDDAEIQNLTITDTLHVTGLTTFVGFTTFNDYVFIQDGLNVTGAGITADTLNVLGVSTFVGFSTFNDNVFVAGVSTFVGFSTFNDYVFIQDGLNVTGVATIATLNAAAGIITASSVNVTGLTTTKDLLVTGVTTSTDKEIYTQFDITNNASGAYEFAATGIGFTVARDNPTLYLTKGKNYRFSVNASGHPFYIKTVNSTGTGNAYDNGVTNNGAAVGVVTFKVPYDAPDILYYNCSNHSSMNGEIRIGGAGAGVGVGSEGTFIGAGATMVDFKSSNGLNTVDLSSGIATVTVQTGASIGLVIALGG